MCLRLFNLLSHGFFSFFGLFASGMVWQFIGQPLCACTLSRYCFSCQNDVGGHSYAFCTVTELQEMRSGEVYLINTKLNLLLNAVSNAPTKYILEGHFKQVFRELLEVRTAVVDCYLFL